MTLNLRRKLLLLGAPVVLGGAGHQFDGVE